MGLYLNKKEVVMFVSFFLIYTFFVQWGGWNENSRLALTKAIVDEGRLEIDSFANQTSDRSFFQGHYYSDKDPGVSLIATMPYSVFKFLFHTPSMKSNQMFFVNTVSSVEIYDILNPGYFSLYSMIIVTVFTSILFSALSVVVIYKITNFFTKNHINRLLITLAAGLATTIFPYAVVFMDNATATFFALFGFYILLKMKKQKVDDKKYSLFAGFSFGLAFLASVITGLVFILSMVYLWNFKKRYLLIFTFGFLVVSSIYLVYNMFAFKTPFTLPRHYMDQKIWSKIGGISGLQIPNAYILWRLLFDPYKGIFFYYPVLLFSIYGLYLMYKKMKTEAVVIFLIFISVLVLNSSWWAWWGGASFGPRHLTYAVPFLLVPSIFVLDEKNKFLKIVFLILLFYSTFINFTSLQPKYDEISSLGNIDVADKFKSKINSFDIFANPIFDYYIPKFIEFGPRSRLIETWRNSEPIDIRFLTPESRQPFVPFSTGQNKEITFVSGWQRSQSHENATWMIKDGEITVDNKDGKENNVFSFYTGANYEDKHLKIFLNSIVVNETIVPSSHSILVELKNLGKGQNIIILKTVESCKIPQIEENKTDKRCLDIYVDHVSFKVY